MRLAAAVHYVPRRVDARKRSMTLENLLTMQSGLAWKESGYAYGPAPATTSWRWSQDATGRST